MIDRLSPLARNLALLALVLLLVWFCWTVRSVLNPLILGYLLAFILHPLVLRLEKRKWTRRKAVNVIFGAFAVGLVLLGTAIFFQARSFVNSFASDEGFGKKIDARIAEAVRDHQEELQWMLKLLPQKGGKEPIEAPPGAPESTEPSAEVVVASKVSWAEIQKQLLDLWRDSLTPEQRESMGKFGLQAGAFVWVFLQGIFGGVLAFLGLVVLWPIYTYFLLFELERIHSFVSRYLPHQERDRIVRIGTQIGEVLASFFRGRLLVCLIKGAFLAVGLAIADVPYALLLGLGTGFLSLIPFVGSAIGYGLTFLIAMLDHGLVSALWRTGTVFFLAEMLENYLLIPKILGDSLGLHPIVVIFAIMAGGASMGMFGLLVALPITASLVILAREFLLPVLAQMADKEKKEAQRAARPGRGG